MENPVRQLRTSLDMSQETFAARIGVGQPHISGIEQNRTFLSGEKALLIADLWPATMDTLGLTVEDLLRGERAA